LWSGSSLAFQLGSGLSNRNHGSLTTKTRKF